MNDDSRSVETRLTAEQFYAQSWPNIPSKSDHADYMQFAEAFRGKSEAGLREENERLTEGERSVREFLERDYGVSEITTICSRYDDAEQELTELRVKLAVAETYGKVCDKQITDLGKVLERGKPTPDGGALVSPTAQQEEWIAAIEQAECQIESFAPLTLTNIKALRAEAEAAALRERERWIPVEEKLPGYGSCIHVYGYPDEVDSNVRIQDLATYSYHNGWAVGAPADLKFKVTHWKALSPGPEIPTDLQPKEKQ